MKYKKYEFPTYNIYTIKTDRFKNCQMEIIFHDNYVENRALECSMICDILSTSSKNYPRKKEMYIKQEELYKLSFYGMTNRIGSCITNNFVVDFMNPKYAMEKTYLNDVVEYAFDVLQNPNIKDNEFDNRIFNIIKTSYQDRIKSIKEDPNRLAIFNGLNAMDPDSITTSGLIKSEPYLKEITPESLYKTYKNMLNNSLCDIFIIGNLDMDKVVKLINKYFKCRVIKNHEVNILYQNKERKRVNKVSDAGNFVQSNLLMIYNLNNLDKFERDTVFNVFNNILGTEGLNSRLYKYLREENSLCYGVNSMYLKYDKLLIIKVSLAKENIPKAIKLIKKAISELQKGKITEEEIIKTKTNLMLGVSLSMDNPSSILNNYAFNVYDNIPLLKDREKSLMSVTKKDIINVAKKLKLNTIYTFLEEGKSCKK